jgi:hypothetical protein
MEGWTSVEFCLSLNRLQEERSIESWIEHRGRDSKQEARDSQEEARDS